MSIKKKGQMGPQGLEDLPIAILAFIIAITFIILFLGISSDHVSENQMADMHDTGKRIVDILVGDIFKSNYSTSYGSNILDAAVIDSIEPCKILDAIGPIEYYLYVEIHTPKKNWFFGTKPPEVTLSYARNVTVLKEGVLYDGEVIVRIWK
jgi:hypothetical protein